MITIFSESIPYQYHFHHHHCHIIPDPRHKFSNFTFLNQKVTDTMQCIQICVLSTSADTKIKCYKQLMFARAHLVK